MKRAPYQTNGYNDPPENFGSDDNVGDSGSPSSVAADPTLITSSGGLAGTAAKLLMPVAIVAPWLERTGLEGITFSYVSGPSGNSLQYLAQVYVIVALIDSNGKEYIYNTESGPYDGMGDSRYLRLNFNAMLAAYPDFVIARAYFWETSPVLRCGQTVFSQDWSRNTIVGFGGVVLLTSMVNLNYVYEYAIRTLDYTNFDCEAAASYYYPQYDGMPGRQITVSRVRIVYRDLGAFTLKAFIKTAQQKTEQDDPVNYQVRTFGGNIVGEEYTDFFDLVVTGERPQLILIRDANSGPCCIISAALVTDVEIMEQV